MAPTLSLTLKLLFVEEVKDAGGSWRYVSAEGTASPGGETVKVTAAERSNLSGGVPFPASLLTAVVMFPTHGTAVPPNLTLQGVHDLKSNDESGSVSAASPSHAAYIGGSFAFDSKKGLLTIAPRKW